MTNDTTQPLLTPLEVDRLLRYPHGRSARLARAGKLPFVMLPDGAVRFREADIRRLVEATPGTTAAAQPTPAATGGAA